MNKKALCYNVTRISHGSYKHPVEIQRDTEIELCKSQEIPFFLILFDEYPSKGSVPILDLRRLVQPKFGGPVKKSVDSLAGYDLLLRGYFPLRQHSLELITSFGGNNVICLEDSIKVDNWPEYVKSEYLKRKLAVVKASSLTDSVGSYSIDGDIFVKSLFKMCTGHGCVISTKAALDIPNSGLPHTGSLMTDSIEFVPVNDNTDLILSEPVDFKRDEQGTLEYRCWVVDNNVVSYCRTNDPDCNDLSENIPEDISQTSNGFISSHRDIFPRFYAADFGITKDRGVVLVEMNDFTCSGNTSKTVFKKILDAYLTS